MLCQSESLQYLAHSSAGGWTVSLHSSLVNGFSLKIARHHSLIAKDTQPIVFNLDFIVSSLFASFLLKLPMTQDPPKSLMRFVIIMYLKMLILTNKKTKLILMTNLT